ncbi:TetR/AcrR family transcriptional regulator [Paenibacillus oenotherae]|uniref:TetR/AcrR family transcriptional regulator n=1 Tax=Paenibacillus oenotherae TaxID=1435645 RepID=A0ABS7D5H2_9BACL|nr:TetR/AcrR family transcriptional regulator [Paenibacillus oenotherae]MBW7474428.1 TetR/AcrR family transcriptional regulator [Paenibacillus oenotherae]
MNRELKKEQTRVRIKEAAMSLFAEQSYESTTIEQIVKLAGVAKGTFFNYFSSKDDLICDLQGLFVIEEIVKLKDKGGPLIPKMQLIIFELMQQFPLNKQLTRALFQAILGSEKALDKHRKLIADLKDAIIPLVESGQECGELRKEIPAADITQIALHTYFGTLILWSMDEDEEKLNEHMVVTFDLFFKGIVS